MTVVRLRTMRRDDVPAGLQLCRSARWNQTRHDWEFFLTVNPDGCCVAVNTANDIVGSVATIRYGRTFSWVSMVLVDPAHRGAGIGTRLLREALVLLQDIPLVRLDATPAGYAIYVGCGFQEEYHLQRMQRVVQPGHVTPETPARRMTDSDLTQVVDYDRAIFGADRHVLLEKLRRCWPEYAMVVGHDRINGYVFGRQGHAFEHIGPLVARDGAAARHLVNAYLSTFPDRPFIIDIPILPSWAAWLESMQFTLQRPFIRMCRGEQPLKAPHPEMFAITGPEFG